jgi:hypothetical protein
MDSVEDAKSDSGPSDEKACSSALSDLKPSSCAYGGIVEQQPVETSPYVNDDHESLHKVKCNNIRSTSNFKFGN